MIDEIRLKLMRKKPTLADLVKPNPDEKTKVVFRVAMRRSCKKQEKLLREASKIK